MPSRGLLRGSGTSCLVAGAARWARVAAASDELQKFVGKRDAAAVSACSRISGARGVTRGPVATHVLAFAALRFFRDTGAARFDGAGQLCVSAQHVDGEAVARGGWELAAREVIR